MAICDLCSLQLLTLAGSGLRFFAAQPLAPGRCGQVAHAPVQRGSDPLPDGWSVLGTTTELMCYVFPGNLTGLPAISFPAGYDENGLPVGIQAMGRHWDETVLLRIAYAADAAV